MRPIPTIKAVIILSPSSSRIVVQKNTQVTSANIVREDKTVVYFFTHGDEDQDEEEEQYHPQQHLETPTPGNCTAAAEYQNRNFARGQFERAEAGEGGGRQKRSRIMGSLLQFYDGVISKITNGGDSSMNDNSLPKLPVLPNFRSDAVPETPEYRIWCAQLRKQKEDFSRDMVEYTTKMEKIYKKGYKGENVTTNSTVGYRIKSFGFTVSTWVTNEMLNIKVKFTTPKARINVILKRCMKRKFRLETIGTDYVVTKWLFIKVPWKVYAKDLQVEKNIEEDDGSIIIRGPVLQITACSVLHGS